MRSNYKRLGDYIERCDEFNEGMQVKELQGISNNKYFQRSHTNTIGIDLTGYRVVRNNQFAFNRATTRNGDKISIALRDGDDCMVSPSYRIFKVKDENVLNSEYLMMWFRRPEFDRYARFKSHGSAHEFFDYEEMCEVELPIPSVEKQREIVKEYNTIFKGIQLNKKFNKKLDETAQAIYKQWFVDFEFPDKNGNPYKSNGGEMYWNETLQLEIPKGWECCKWGDISKLEYGKGLKNYRSEIGKVPVFGTNGHVGWTNEALVNSEGIIIGRKGIYRGVHYSKVPFHVIDTAFFLAPKIPISLKWAYYEILRLDINSLESGSAIPSTSRDDFYDESCVLPTKSLQDNFERLITTIYANKFLRDDVSRILIDVSNLLFAKISSNAPKFNLVSMS
jgi:type I restriction enzyme S subunit